MSANENCAVAGPVLDPDAVGIDERDDRSHAVDEVDVIRWLGLGIVDFAELGKVVEHSLL